MTLMLSQASGVPFWRQIRDQLADRMRAGTLPPGTLLPSVRQLAADTLVSVITVKRAYDDLEAAGMVVSHQGRGTFVADSVTAASRRDLLASVAEDLAAVVERARRAGVEEAELDALLTAARAGGRAG